MEARHSSPVRYSDEINDKLIKWMNETGYSIVQINGQRISSSPRVDWKPSRGCEVFVGKIPRDCYEDELFPVFQTAGNIHELRLMMMFSGTNRGYAFVMYEHIQDARRAVEQLDHFEIRRGHHIGVLPCVNNCRLFVGCFEADERTEVQMQQVLRMETESVVSVSRRSGRNGRWYLLVEYANHRAAAIARRELTPRRSQLFGPKVIVDWEIPPDKRDRKMIFDHRHALKPHNMLNLHKSNGNSCFLNNNPRENKTFYVGKETQINPLYCEKGAQVKSLGVLPTPRLTTIPCVSYGDILGQHCLLNQRSYSWPPDVLKLSTQNQSPSNASDCYTGAPIVKRPLTRQSSLDLNSKAACRQDASCFDLDMNNNYSHEFVHRQLVCNAQQGLMRSMDSGLYADPECHRPLSSDSLGSAGSSFSLSNWDGSTTSCSSTGSAGNLCLVNWEQGRSNEVVDSNSGNHSQFRKGSLSADGLYQSDLWQPVFNISEDQRNKSGIWNSRFQCEDNELMDNLFTKEKKTREGSISGHQEIRLSLQALSLSRSGHTKNNFVRTIQPPHNGSPAASWNQNLRKCF